MSKTAAEPFNYERQQRLTLEALADPQVGDRFHEMYSYWLYVVAVEGDEVTTLEASAPCTFPDDGKRWIGTREAYRQRFDTCAGPWIMLADRGNDVEGWLGAEREAG